MKDWIKWDGGECPVDDGVKVVYEVRDGVRELEQVGSILRWYHTGSSSDIIAYRIVEETQSHEQPKTYARPFTNRMKAGETFDVYDVLQAFDVPCHKVGHAIKKLLAAGKRNGGKSELQDLKEALWSIQEAIKEKGE